MLELILGLILCYCFFSLLGLGLFFLLTPSHFKNPVLLPALAPMYGMNLVAILATYFLHFNLPMTWLVYWGIGFAGVTGLAALYFRKKESLGLLLQSWKIYSSRPIEVAVSLSLVLLVASAAARGGHITTPYRIGPDQVGYSGAAQFLLEGGTLRSAEADLREQTGLQDLEKAKQFDRNVLKFTTHITTDFLLKGMRWGYPSILAVATSALGYPHVYRLSFTLITVAYGALVVLVYFALTTLFQFSPPRAFLFAWLFGLNCNLLNTWGEGQYAQIITAPGLLILLLESLRLRKKPSFQGVLFLGFFGAGLMSCYNEAFVVIGVLTFFTVGYDLLLERKIKWQWIAVMSAVALCSCLLVTPFSYRWLTYLPKHLMNVRVAGWWQPRWSTAAEVMGWFNIYRAKGTTFEGRGILETLATHVCSALIAFSVIFTLIREDKKKFDLAFWLAAPTFVVLIYIKLMHVEHIQNYQYMKAFTLTLPILFLLVYRSLFFVLKAPGLGPAARKLLTFTLGFAVIATFASGISYLQIFRDQSGYVSEDAFSLPALDRKIDLSRYAFYTPRLWMNDLVLATLFPFNWLNFFKEINYGLHPQKRAALYIEKDELNCPQCFVKAHAQTIFYETSTFILVDSGHLVGEGLRADGSLDYRRIFADYQGTPETNSIRF